MSIGHESVLLLLAMLQSGGSSPQRGSLSPWSPRKHFRANIWNSSLDFHHARSADTPAMMPPIAKSTTPTVAPIPVAEAAPPAVINAYPNARPPATIMAPPTNPIP